MVVQNEFIFLKKHKNNLIKITYFIKWQNLLFNNN